jgi:phage gpG-like protein
MADSLAIKTDVTAATKQLARMRAALVDMRPPLSDAARVLTRRVRERFVSRTDPDGNRWKPWAKATAAQTGKKPMRKLMFRTGATRSQSRFVVSRNSVQAVLGTSYAAFHEQPSGTTAPSPRSKLPRRAFMFSNKSGKPTLAQRDEKYLSDAIEKHLLRAARS